MVGAAFAGALLGRNGDGADGEEAEEEGEGGCETHLDLMEYVTVSLGR